MAETSNECRHGCMWWDSNKPDTCTCWTGMEHLPMPFSRRYARNHA